MFIGHFTEQPWQDEKTNLMGARNTTLDISNRLYDPAVGAELYNRYLGYMVKVHVEETAAKAEEVGRKYLTGVPNPEIAGNPGEYLVKPWLQSPPGLSSRDAVKRRLQILGVAAASGPDSRGATIFAPYEEQVKHLSIITGTPASVLPKIRHILETLRPGVLIFWDGDGAMNHEDQMRSLKLMGGEIWDYFASSAKGAFDRAFYNPAQAPEYAHYYGKVWTPDKEEQVERNREMAARLLWKPYMRSHTLRALLRGIATPTLLVWGREDAIIPLNTCQLYQKAMQGSTIALLDHCGHMPEMEKSGEFVNVVLDFLTAGS